MCNKQIQATPVIITSIATDYRFVTRTTGSQKQEYEIIRSYGHTIALKRLDQGMRPGYGTQHEPIQQVTKIKIMNLNYLPDSDTYTLFRNNALWCFSRDNKSCNNIK